MRQSLTAAILCSTAAAQLSVRLSVADGILNGTADGHVQLLFAPEGTDPLDDTDVTSSPNYFYGQNVFGLENGGSVTLSGGDGQTTDFGIWGFPNISLNDIEPGNYTVQGFFNPYENVTRGDGSVVSLRFPYGDGAPGISGYGTPITDAVNYTISGDVQTIELTFSNYTESEDFTGNEIGGDQQGNYEDTEFLKYVKIRSDVLSEWWGRDVYVGANVLLPYGYNATDNQTRYPVLYYQGHWPGSHGPFTYSSEDSEFAYAWNNGTIPATNETEARPTPKMIIAIFRHETPFYDDSYAVNTANLGPWGDAINDEMIPHLDSTFNTIAQPYARVQQGGSTGGWESIASLIYRPDLFGATFTSYPDSLDFHRHQDIHLYDYDNAYVTPDGVPIVSIRGLENDTEVVEATVKQENAWELTYGTSSRSFQQWDIWNAVFGAQGYNNYPLEPWDKVTGEIYHEAVEYWKPFDLSNWVTSNWNNSLNLGTVLAGRIWVYVGLADNYFLNEGVAQFQAAVEAKGGAGWANFTYIENAEHGGVYNRLDVWDFLDLVDTWFVDHAPNGTTPLDLSLCTSASRGNKWEDVISAGGRQAAIDRQAPPEVTGNAATVGRWDPGVKLVAQWVVNGSSYGESFAVEQGAQVTYNGTTQSLQIAVTGTKRGYATETRTSS